MDCRGGAVLGAGIRKAVSQLRGVLAPTWPRYTRLDDPKAMCGIWSSVGFPPNSAHIDAGAHRGPDGSGWRVFESIAGSVALGHRRLSIIDLSDAARQPMAYAVDRY